MNVLTAFGLYLGLFFAMIALALFHVLPINYLGGIIIALFIGGLCYGWLNAWRQTNRLIKVELEEDTGRQISQSSILKRNKEETKQKRELEEGVAAQVPVA